jgi:antitoxin ParD1/3/4
MNVSLTPELEAVVRDKVKSGLYNNASEVMRDALRRMMEQDRLQEERLRAALAIGLEQIERGETVRYTPEMMERLKREATANALAGKPIPDDVRP